MTPERIRIKVAEAMGWKVSCRGPSNTARLIMPNGIVKDYVVWLHRSEPTLGSLAIVSRLPNYPADLNACAEFEKTLYPDRAEHYYNTLRAVITNNEYHGVMEGYNGWFMLHATALQRCEAYLRVKGLWEETP